ncbi:glycoside hydrolase family 19 protein [Palleniella muris]|uniref:Glycoside hydrolase family 19 protein n=1 Tax=Palleniella muris TaxID=3038145 RepID=A0AC61QMB2_9BACT|nr:glycoside hydrolase family 19 protein [Palleniella muris]TGX80525.1 glycoside hydrolase family 19 protein [Palleniella muris]
MQITREQIIAIMPCANNSVDKYLPYINKYAEEFQVNTSLRIVHFLAQVAVESNELRCVEENLNYSSKGLLTTFPKYFSRNTAALYARKPEKIANKVYANRCGNGNEASGDGWRYRGRGLFQLTFRANYSAYKTYCGFDVVNKPDLIAQPLGATRSAFWYWWKHGLNLLADADNTIAIRKKINGGTNGLPDVQKYVERGKKVFNI